MHDYKDPAGRTRIAVACVATYMALELIYAATLLYDHLTGPGYIDPSEARNSDFVALAVLAVMIVCFVAVGMWIYRASANAHAISDEMTITPGWAVGWYFVPIMNLFKPYQGMREIWLASHFRGNWHGEPAPGLLGWWWGLWLVTNVLGNISFRLGLEMEAGAAAAPVVFVDVAGAALNVPLSLILIGIMRKTAHAQSYAVHEETFA